MAENMNAIHIMSYDYHGSWETTQADHHAALYPSTWDPDMNAETTLKTLMDLGAPANKLVLGIPTYGRSWTVTGTNMSPPVSATGAGIAGPITAAAGSLGYQEICLNILNHGWTLVEDNTRGPYAYDSGTNQWVGYDTISSVATKAAYISSKGLAGAMFWDLATDDFNVRQWFEYKTDPVQPALLTLNSFRIAVAKAASHLSRLSQTSCKSVTRRKLPMRQPPRQQKHQLPPQLRHPSRKLLPKHLPNRIKMDPATTRSSAIIPTGPIGEQVTIMLAVLIYFNLKPNLSAQVKETSNWETLT